MNYRPHAYQDCANMALLALSAWENNFLNPYRRQNKRFRRHSGKNGAQTAHSKNHKKQKKRMTKVESDSPFVGRGNYPYNLALEQPRCPKARAKAANEFDLFDSFVATARGSRTQRSEWAGYNKRADYKPESDPWWVRHNPYGVYGWGNVYD